MTTAANVQGRRWTDQDIPDQKARVALVTGANSGTGFETARMLAEHGASVLLGCRNHDSAVQAAERIRGSVPDADVTVIDLDLASLDSVRAAAEQVHSQHGRLDLLINNAGFGWLPFARSRDGLELTMATNHFGHFALTGRLLDLLLDTPGSRVVAVTSPAHRQAKLDLENFNDEQAYTQRAAYSNSKLANLLFAYELQRRLHASGADTIALAAHPGGARSNFNRNLPWLLRGPNYGLAYPLSHPSSVGALSILRAAADPDAAGGDYYAPARMMELRGLPKKHQSSTASHDPQLQRRLWETSEQLTGVTYNFRTDAPVAAPGKPQDRATGSDHQGSET
jgi:NAD(P)-dependent dehydrogenase (short-subunit alcohol dehydrogenase family)